ncbi:hypothetical protein LTR56_015832 [Elasticomyces elasticus]|nr:hypothetical protein LTR22_023031 [Elasticomyces elasticus]KAK3633417.1 hypothetical protein LTR56_015832 [Elasticomyces elasticus]KAK4922038.1 hypothetical protein LTR49_010624 [Elasticomyces elasticus]KAK5747810.1 hypothetical protein LTS12_022165 [Elasticomyces elasticus]
MSPMSDSVLDMSAAAQAMAVLHLGDPEFINASVTTTGTAIPTTAHPTIGRLGTFPHEILMEVFRHSLVRAKQPVCLRSKYMREALARALGDKTDRSRNFNVFLVNKAFYFAATEVYYGGNAFELGYAEDVTETSKTIGPGRKSFIKSVKLKLHWCVALGFNKVGQEVLGPEVKRALEEYAALQNLEVSVNPVGRHHNWLPPDAKPLIEDWVARNWTLAGVVEWDLPRVDIV